MYVGIEIGGTKLQLGVGPGDGTIRAIERFAVDPSRGAAGIRQQLEESMPRLLAAAGVRAADIAAVGIGFGGPVDAARGVVTRSHQVDGWTGFELSDWSRRRFGWPTVVHNDADTAGLAEASFGAGRGHSPVFYITIGSGIGGGLVIDECIYRGAGAGAAEIGQMRLPAGQWGEATTLEAIASGWGMARRASGLFPGTADLESVGVPRIVQAADQGNLAAARIIAEAIEALASSIAHVIALLCPSRIVIGGGVSNLGERVLFQPLRARVAELVFEPFAPYYEIVPAALGESVVVHGALKIARDYCLRSS